ncbi:peptidase domain-containing ABC transporter [Labedella phragmitis]|uniref:Peptidase domain-containing ABC transporter n=1 Tax=Labedella phragmitis TaxID=2498849 RepID=A0A444PXB1_9MICO|nr:peptidase domain-containing ABC transporter [Labedella phragmitis]RWZ52503.1 peptidase domain-containing ABC transporter [Labedella phragmitis]
MTRQHVRQNESSDCGAACLAAVSAAHGKTVSVTQLRDALGTAARGVSVRGLVDGAVELGFEAKVVRVGEDALTTSYTRPAIAHVTTSTGDPHFVVIHLATSRRLLIGDPAEKRRRWVAVDDFLARFTGVLVLLAPSRAFDPGGSQSRPVGRFLRLLRPHRALFLWAILGSLILTILGIATSFATKIIVDEVIPYDLESLIVPLGVLFVGMYVVQHAVQFVRQWIVLHLSQRIDVPLILGYFAHVYRMPFRFFDSRPVGDILTRFGDAMTIKNVLTGAALSAVLDAVMAIVTGAVLFSLDASLFLVIVVFVIASVVLVVAFLRPFRAVNGEQMQQASVLNSRIIEGLRGVEGIKLEGFEPREMEGVEREYIRSVRFSFREGMLENGQSTLMSLFQAAAGLLLLLFGTTRIIDGDLTLGTLMAFVALSAFFIDPVSRLIGLQLEWQEASMALRRVAEILDYEPEGDEVSGSDEVDDVGGEVRFDSVSFGYRGRATALRDMSFSIREGERVAFVGPSGGGKSTIAKLLLRVVEPDEGGISLSGVPLERISPAVVRSRIAYVPQQISLYSRSVADNVRLSSPDASPHAVRRALHRAHADEFVAALPHGASTVLDEAGAGLSGGERRRLGLARALLKESPLYVLDEVTSDLDASTEAHMIEDLMGSLPGATLIMIAHRLASVMRCDRIFVVEAGRIVEEGTHSELVELGGVYAEMWAVQRGDKRPAHDRVDEARASRRARGRQETDAITYR